MQFEKGQIVSFEYPAHNFNGVLSYMEPRKIVVESVRDLVKIPLDWQTFDIQPLLRRSRHLVIGHDLEKNATRRFYDGSMKMVQVEPKVEPRESQK